MKKIIWCYFIIAICLSCKGSIKKDNIAEDINSLTLYADSVKPTIAIDSHSISNDAEIPNQSFPQTILQATPNKLVAFAKSLIGITYKYASTDPNIGFDCSGFITYVFNHFNIKVPRSSVGFTNIGKEIKIKDAREGDLILFTGTVDSIRIVGHMGIVTDNIDTLKFIHSTSGRKYGVTISEFSNHYKSRFVKVVRIFKD